MTKIYHRNMAKNHGVTHKFEVILAPLVTEKTTSFLGEKWYAFSVATKATKFEIKQAIEELFKVKVVDVRTLNRVGKVKRFRGTEGQRSTQRRAYVKLMDGHKIDIMAGA